LARATRTLTSSSSRRTAVPASSSTILSTCTSLLSCLVTCSSGDSSTLTTMVIREISGCSVSPTDSESMLNPRRANRLATRARMPGVFSTSTERVCLLMLASSQVVLVEGRARAAGELDLVVAGTGRDHRPDHGVLADHEVDHHRHVLDRHRRLDGPVHVGGGLAAQPGA